MATKISFAHFHDGNDPEHAVRGTAVYATRGRLVDLSTGDVLSEAWAYCSPNDPPSRKKGREIVLGRLTTGRSRAKERTRTPAGTVANLKNLGYSALAMLGI